MLLFCCIPVVKENTKLLEIVPKKKRPPTTLSSFCQANNRCITFFALKFSIPVRALGVCQKKGARVG